MIELSERLVLPEGLSWEWYDRGYDGTVNHDSKAVDQRRTQETRIPCILRLGGG